MNIQTLSETMLREGFEYCSMVDAPSLDAYRSPPQTSAAPSVKPTFSTLYCSRLQTRDGETVPEWYDFVVGEEYETDAYSRKDLLFVKADSSRLVFAQDQRFRTGGAWRKETQHISTVLWSSVAAEAAGIVVDPSISEVRDVFPMWDVDTLAIWDGTCVKEHRAFRNVGAWLYEAGSGN